MKPEGDDVKSFTLPCDLSWPAIEDGLEKIDYCPPVVSLHCHKNQYYYALEIVHDMAGKIVNPFAPSVHVLLEDGLDPGEWYLKVNDKIVFSKGV